jgi:hypothetical protein
MSEPREIKLPADLCVAAEQKFGARSAAWTTSQSSRQELIRGDTVDSDRADQAVVEQRLTDLGYM